MMNQKNDQINRLVGVLMFAFRIKDDDSLVDVLGNGFEVSNEEALNTWIKTTLLTPDMQIAESVLPRLIDLLEELLRKRGENY